MANKDYQTFVNKYPSGYSVRVKFGSNNRLINTSDETQKSKEKSIAFAKRLAEKNKGSFGGFKDMTVSKNTEKMASRVKDYSYIKRSDISVLKATIDGKVLDVDPKTILSGTYVAGKIKPTASKLRVAKTDPASIREKLLKKYKDFAEDEYNADFEKYITVEDIKKFVECGLTEEMIMAFYGGIECVMDIKADNEFSYNALSGVFSYRTDEDGRYIKNWVERGLYNCENGVYELGFKYPEFNWSFLKRTDNTEVISTEPYDYFGKKRVDRIKLEKYKVNDKFTFIACKSAGYSEDGVFSKYSDRMLNAGAPLELNGNYLALVSRNAKELFALAKKLLSQPKGYVKEFDWLVQDKTSGATELKEANYKFANGGNINAEIDGLEKGDMITIEYGSSIQKNNKVILKVRSRNKVRQGTIDKITFDNTNNPSGVKFYAYNRGKGWSFAIGDMGISNVKIVYAKGVGIEKANLGALLIAEKAKGIAPKSFDAADTKIANRFSRKSFAERMSETGNEEFDQNQYEANKFAKGGMMKHGLRVGDKILSNRTDYLIEIKDTNGDKYLVDLNMGNRIRLMAMGGGIEDDYMSFARTNARESIDWNEEVRNYAGDNYDNLTEEEKESIIAEMQMNWDYQHSFAKGGVLSEAKYISREEIVKVELKNGKTIENSYNSPIYSGLRIGKGITEREEMEAKGQTSLFKRGGTMPKYAKYVSQREIAKVYIGDEDEPKVISGRDLIGGVWYDNEKTEKLIATARKQGLIK